MGAEVEDTVQDSSGGPHWRQNGGVRQSGWSRLPRHLSTASKIWSAFICAVMGVVFYWVGGMISDEGGGLQGGTTVEGTVIATPFSGSDSGTCARRVRYYVDGIAYEASSSIASSGACGKTGGTAKVSYLPSSPASARVIDDEAGWFGLIFKVIGGAMVVWAAVQVVSLIRALTSDRSAAVIGSVPGQQLTDLGDLTFAEPAPTPGPGGYVQPPPLPPPAVAPPPGWYLDPAGPAEADGPGAVARQRWWDGRVWTEHRR